MLTCIVSSPVFLEHKTGSFHLESPDRLVAIENAIKKSFNLDEKSFIAPRLAQDSSILLCHSRDYLSLVKKEVHHLEKEGGLRLLSTGDTVISPRSLEAARYAVGAVLEACDAVMQKRCSNAFCLVRPPGHHATKKRGMGFCIFNNVAIGARYVQKHYGIERVLICDWDLHHGNGTQDIFEKDPSVFYVSTHQQGIYPGTGAADDTGQKTAIGTKLNFPIMPGPHAKEQILAVFEKTLQEKMASFKPQFVFISCGFDAHREDPLGALNLDDEDYFALTRAVKKIADHYCEGRLVSVLEGGYNLSALGRCAVKHIQGLQAP